MYEDILVTVVTCVHNTPQEYLKEAVESILTQTHKNFEYFIVDDCSDEDLYNDSIFEDSRISIIKSEKNIGPGAARNIAFDRAAGKYIAIMDSDDISLPTRLEKQVAYMEENEAVVACGTWFTHFGNKTNAVKREIRDNEYYRCCLLFGNSPTLLNPSVMLRKSSMDEHFIRYDERLLKGEDYKMWVQLSKIGICTNLEEDLFRYRVHESQTSEKLRTKDTSPYDFAVIKEQYDEVGVVLSEEEEKIIKREYRSDKVDAYSYLKLLEKILKANEKSRFFVQEKLEKRVEEQWRSKVYNTGACGLLRLMARLPKSERKKIIRMQRERFLKK